METDKRIISLPRQSKVSGGRQKENRVKWLVSDKRISRHLTRLSPDEDILGIVKQLWWEFSKDGIGRRIHKTVMRLIFQVMWGNVMVNSNWIEKVELGPGCHGTGMPCWRVWALVFGMFWLIGNSYKPQTLLF